MPQYRLASHTIGSISPVLMLLLCYFLEKNVEMKLTVRRLKDGRYSFRYTCPKTHKFKTMRGKNKQELSDRRAAIQKEQGSRETIC